MVQLAREKPRYGYRRLHVLLRRVGEAVNHKRLYRIYRAVRVARSEATLAMPMIPLATSCGGIVWGIIRPSGNTYTAMGRISLFVFLSFESSLLQASAGGVARAHHDWIDIVTALSTVTMAAFTIVTAFAVLAQVKSHHRRERAWLALESLKPSRELEFFNYERAHVEKIGLRRTEVICTLKNYGPSPARVADVRTRFEAVTGWDAFSTTPNHRRNDRPFNNIKGGYVVVPNDTFDFPIPFDSADGGRFPSDDEMELARKTGFFALYVSVSYIDVFRNKHETNFCYWFEYLERPPRNSSQGQFQLGGPPAYNEQT